MVSIEEMKQIIKLESEEEEKLAHNINPQEIKILRGKKNERI